MQLKRASQRFSLGVDRSFELSGSLRGSFALRPRHFIPRTGWFSSSPLHELVESFEISALSATGEELGRLQSGKLFSHRCGDELVYARPVFLALPLHSSLYR